MTKTRTPAKEDKDLARLLSRVGARVRELRQDRGWTLRRLADEAHLSTRFVSQLEAGQGNIAIGRLAGVAKAFGVRLESLLSEAHDPVREEIAELLEGRTSGELQRARDALRATLAKRPAMVALLGMRGAGKSTLGAALANQLEVPFVELDDKIEAVAGLSMGELFALHGEPYVRRLEGKCLEELAHTNEPAVVALTGGVVANPEALELLTRHAVTVWLQATPEDHMQRVLDQGDQRPMAESEDAMSELRAILSAREPHYRKADYEVDTSAAGSPEAALQELLNLLRPE